MKKVIAISVITVLAMITSCSKQKYPDLGDGYSFDSDGKYTLSIVNSQNTIMVGSHILEYAFDTTFVIVSQRPWDDPSIPGLKEMTYYKRREAFERSTFRQYWIINKKDDNIYSYDEMTKTAKYSNVCGPFSKEEFLQKREKLGVPRELQLKE